EGDHMRGTQLMHTAWRPNPAIQYPSIGSIAAHEVPKLPGYQDISLPNYISIGGGRGAEGPGFLGMNYAPFTVQNPGSPPENIRAPSGLGSNDLEQMERIRRRQRLFYDLEDQFMTGRVPHLQSE